jgi:hypothetical protein
MAKTLFEEIKEELDLESGDSPFFYRRALRRLVQKYAQQPQRLIREERQDNTDLETEQDKNLLRTVPKVGHMFIFEYETVKKSSKYYDRFPLVYVISTSGNSFIGGNLHYIEPRRRMIVVNNLKEGRISIPYNCISKYNMSQVKSLYLDIAFNEWNSACLIPIENFVIYKDGKETSIRPIDVWTETNKTFRKMLRGNRQYRGYGKNDSDFKGD